MKYKGIELKEVTEPQLFDPPNKMLVWDRDNKYPSTANVYAIVSRKYFPVICENSTWRHCAEIPESTLATFRELSRWIAQGNGELVFGDTSTTCYPYLTYQRDSANVHVGSDYSVRKWDDTEWHKPTREYLGLEDK